MKIIYQEGFETEIREYLFLILLEANVLLASNLCSGDLSMFFYPEVILITLKIRIDSAPQIDQTHKKRTGVIVLMI